MNYKLIFIFSLFFNQLFSKDWINPSFEKCNYSYVYAPGLSSTETQLAKYCPKFIASTGELVTCTRGVETIQSNVSGCIFAEVNLRINKDTFSLWKQLNYALVGLKHKQFGINIQTKPDSINSLSGHYVNLFNLNVGQDNDINIYKAKVGEHLKKQKIDKDSKIILYGISRGSATVFNYFALHDSDNVAAVVCEGIFDSLSNVAYHGNLLAKLKIKALNNIKITKFKSDGICPLTCANKINKNKPMALITSLADEVVPFKCTLNLYKKLRKSGHRKVHLLILKTSTHNVYGIGSEKEIYQNFMHAFYKNYGLPYIEEFANKGQKTFNKTQPDLNFVDTLLA